MCREAQRYTQTEAPTVVYMPTDGGRVDVQDGVWQCGTDDIV